MKRISAIALFSIVTLAAANGLVAQEAALKANIPFNFTVGDKSMPAGEYTISSPQSHVVQIRSVDGRNVESVIALRSFNESAAGSELIFNKYGQYYFLDKVLSPTITSMNLNIVSGKVEKRARTWEAELQTGEQTLVAAR